MAIDLMVKGEIVPSGKDGQLFCGPEWSGKSVGFVQSTSGSNTKVSWKGMTRLSEMRRDGSEAPPC